MINKANQWKSNDEWKLEKVKLKKSEIISPRVSKVYYRIRNLSKSTALGVTENGIKVTEQLVDENEKGQLWEKESINEGYFTLTSFLYQGKLLTTASDGHLEITGINLISFTDLSEGCVSLLKRCTINHIFRAMLK